MCFFFFHKQNWDEKPEEKAQLSALEQQTATDRHTVSQTDGQECDSMKGEVFIKILDTTIFPFRSSSLM